MRDFEIERRNNRLGENDILKFYLPPQDKTMFLETHLIVDVPSGVAYEAETTVCARELENGQQIQLECDTMALPMSDGNGYVLRSVRIQAVCN